MKRLAQVDLRHVHPTKKPEDYIREAKLAHDAQEARVEVAYAAFTAAKQELEDAEASARVTKLHLDNLYIQQFPECTQDLLRYLKRQGVLDTEKKVNIIKAVRAAYKTGLRESKALVDSLYQ